MFKVVHVVRVSRVQVGQVREKCAVDVEDGMVENIEECTQMFTNVHGWSSWCYPCS